jgi:glycosyltransferase involved in cell wall biosynthesis
VNNKKLRILLVTPLPPPRGGVANWSFRLVAALREYSFVDLSVIDTAVRWRRPDDYRIWRRVVVGGVFMLRDLVAAARVLFRGRYDVCHVNSFGELSLFRDLGFCLLLRIFKIPMVLHIRHGRSAQILSRGGLYARVLSFVLRRAQFVIALDRSSYSAVSAICGADRVAVLPNFLNTDYFASPVDASSHSSRENVVLFAGWVIRDKGVGELLRAWRAVARNDWKLVIAGPLSEEYEVVLKAEFGALGGVEFVGSLSEGDVRQLLRTASVFVLPSYTEGFPNVVLEAMASGCAVLATNVGAVPDMVADGAGLVVPVKSDAELAVGLEKLVSDPDFRLLCAARAWTRARTRYASDVVVPKYIDVWRNAVSQQV